MGSGRAPGYLATHSAWRPVQDPGHRAARMAMSQAQTQRLTFFRSQVSICSRVHGNTIARLVWQCCTWN